MHCLGESCVDDRVVVNSGGGQEFVTLTDLGWTDGVVERSVGGFEESHHDKQTRPHAEQHLLQPTDSW